MATRIITPHQKNCKRPWVLINSIGWHVFTSDSKLHLTCSSINCKAFAEIDGKDILKLLETDDGQAWRERPEGMGK